MSDRTVETTTAQERRTWMALWAAEHGATLELEGECGFGRECVGLSNGGCFADYEWHNDSTYEREDKNGDVWTPEDAYHKHPCVAVLGRGDKAEEQLFNWLKWFDANGFTVECGNQPMDPRLGVMGVLLGKHRFVRMVKQSA